MTEEQVARHKHIHEMLESGLSQTEIARIECVSRARIGQILKRYKEIMNEEDINDRKSNSLSDVR